eukprot:10879791-Prorocentrum_lima.AAC.1
MPWPTLANVHRGGGALCLPEGRQPIWITGDNGREAPAKAASQPTIMEEVPLESGAIPKDTIT